MSYNLCGECNACCSIPTLESEEMEWRNTIKVRNELCDQWCGGCKIYEQRPQACRNFECLWLRIKKSREDYSEARRPNEIGFMVSTTTTKDGIRFVIDEVRPNSFNLEDMNAEQSDFFEEVLYLASVQKEKVEVIWRSFDGKDIRELDYSVDIAVNIRN